MIEFHNQPFCSSGEVPNVVSRIAEHNELNNNMNRAQTRYIGSSIHHDVNVDDYRFKKNNFYSEDTLSDKSTKWIWLLPVLALITFIYLNWKEKIDGFITKMILEQTQDD